MREVVRWLLARRVGEADADRFLEELDELHRLKVEAEGEAAGDRWMRRELRRALVSGMSGLGEGAHDLVRDLRFGLHTLRRRPLFAALVVGTLGLGSGASTTVFSLVDGVLLRDMGYQRPGELVTIWKTSLLWRADPVLAEAWDKLGLRWDEFLTLRDETRTFSEVAVHRPSTATLSGVGDPVRLDAGEASVGLFSLLGIRPDLGRAFLPGEEGPGAPRLAVLSHELWESRFGSDPAILGRSVTLNGKPFEVIGVLPRGFRIHSSIYNLLNSAIDTGDRALWVPTNWDRSDPNSSTDLEAVGRLRPGVTREEALAEVDALLRADRSRELIEFRLAAPKEEVVGTHRASLFLLLGASGFLLLIACANAAVLLLGEAVDRRGEICTRVALGAGRARIARQLLSESLILGVAGSLVGLVLTPMGIRAFLALGPALPRVQEVEVNRMVLLASILTGVACAMLFGFGPALLQHKRSIHALLQRGGWSGTVRGGKVQATLVACELALTVVLLITGGLLARSLGELGRVDPGFDARGVATVRVLIPEGHFGSGRQARLDGARQLRREILRRVEALPGARGAGAINGLPFPGRASGTTFRVEAAADEEPQPVTARNHTVSRGYFGAMGIPLLAGRDFTDADGDEGADAVVIINETMARQFWHGGPPLGARIGEGSDLYRIIGVVGDVRERHLAEEPLPMVYRHASLSSRDFSIVARTTGDPGNLVPLMREAVRGADPGVPVAQGTTMEALVTGSEGAERFRTFLVAAFGFLATLLALVGVFGVTARSVAHRSRELGIRKALGARSAGLIRVVTLGTLRAGTLGIAFGLLGALLATRLLKTFFFGVQPWDAWTFAGTVLLLASLCVGAAILAAGRATRVAPMRVLREE